MKDGGNYPVNRQKTGLVLGLPLILLFAIPQKPQAAQANIDLGTASAYAVLAGSTITNSGPTTLCGNLGLSPGTSVTGAPVLICGGVPHVTDVEAAQAQLDLTAAYTDAAGRFGGTALITAGDIGGQTLYPGLYTEASSLALTGPVTLDALGDSTAVFIIQIGSTLTTAAGSSVVLVGGAQAANVYWQIGTTCTLGTTTSFKGNILALDAIIFDTGAVLEGRALARNAEVTFLTNTITIPILLNTYTPTPVPTQTASFTPSFTDTLTITATFTPTFTDTFTSSFTDTYTLTASFTPSYTPSSTDTFTATHTPSFTPVFTDTFTATDTPSFTPSFTDTFTATDTPSFTPIFTDTFTDTYTHTDTFTPSYTPSFTDTFTATDTPSFTPIFTDTFTHT